MSKTTIIVLAAGAGALVAWGLSAFGRAVIAGKGAADIGDAAAADLASGLSFVDALVAGARVLVGKNPFANPSDVYSVRESAAVASPSSGRWMGASY